MPRGGHLDELKKTISGRAAVFVETYNRVLDEVVPGMKAGVEPYTTGPIGFCVRSHEWQATIIRFVRHARHRRCTRDSHRTDER